MSLQAQTLVSYLKGICVLMSELVHLGHLFFAFFETSEVVLNEESGVEFTHSHIIISCCEENNGIVSQCVSTEKVQLLCELFIIKLFELKFMKW